MSAFGKKTKTNLAEALLNDISLGWSKYYFVEGQPYPWDDDANPPNLNMTLEEEISFRDNMISAFRINSNDVSLVVPRINWESGNVYEQYDTLETPENTYVLTSTYRIYRCIWNANGGLSTVDPDTQDLNTAPYGYFEAADGYIWKYLGTIPLGVRIKFLSDQFMPIMRTRERRLSYSGELSAVSIVSPGVGYTAGGTTISVLGDGFGATASFTLDQQGSFESVVIDNPGSAYTYAYIEITGDGSGAELIPYVNYHDSPTIQAEVEDNAVPGDISNIVVENPGGSYDTLNPPEIIIEGDGEGATASPVILNGEIVEVQITNRGRGYTRATAKILNPLTTPGVGAEFRVNLSPFKGHGYDIISDLEPRTLCFFGGDINQVLDKNRLVDTSLRQVGILKNPETFSSHRFSGIYGDLTYKVYPTEMDSNLILNTDVVIGGGRTHVVSVKESFISLVPKNNFSIVNIKDIETFQNANGVGIYYVKDIEPPDFDRMSGELLMVKNEVPYEKTLQQMAYHRFYLTF